ncbi:peptidoglycan DD-metalloendopeptidase family protein [Gammaproteobacteria bacterium]|jgi:murein DD-endopeptidase MepM/ murein hydrolase activator NlpD|nr:peptidoglycan DD-metalloendopeptidase family protein [Gammaproteobacteria bacterium]MDA9814920.1 peptidoglycan DD-metalloendopeptidase family protein [Gammaproteobacteria bacterium]MDC0401823.1 peptidoglycan DD-metalloendopeptidase family protein [Gammaproteobacteria bacterium]MDC6460525.1 peptidoglycan DD-metalloendopeptidase family protein [Gammaproteobacteria bacterium]
MVGFKKVPTKSVLIIFFLSIFLIMLLYADFVTDDSLPEERIEISEKLNEQVSDLFSYRIHEVLNGENLSIIFEEFRLPLNTAYKIFRLDKNNLLSKIKPGDEMKFSYLGDDITSIEITKDSTNSILIEISNDISIKKISKDVELIKSFKSGIIKTSFYEAALDADIPDSIIMDFAYILGWDIDFVFDIRKGDSFYVIYETPYSSGEQIQNGDIVTAKFINKGKTYSANRFFTDKNKKEFFDNDGNNMQKAFLRAPLDFAYISSHFNPNRMHPVLHTIRAHNGVDYAAKRGSPVRSTGDGSVQFVGRKNGCGNEIVIKHSNDISTRYCHLEGFASNIRKAKKVNQGDTIGFVGSTGLATGPHLHYEFKIGGKNIDPIKVKLPSAEPISKEFKSSFDTLVEDNKLLLSRFEYLYPNEYD